MFFSFLKTESNSIGINSNSNFRYLLLLSALAVSLGGEFRPTPQINPPPEAMLVLGGHEERERYAARLARQYPQIPIWVSSGSPQEYAQKIFAQAGIESERLYFDYRASDTVTNFTTLVDELEARGIDSVYLITSENHMRRAKIIGHVIFGSRGIDFQPISVPSQNPPEPVEKCWRDGARSILWLITGHTGTILLKYSGRDLKLL